ncbi:Tumor necrosis factor receptor superfamily member 9 [Tupaia chinensis]|uniref:Tumor necrosis factor receptor superfamily member 9 n=1 Tax=Tupaia chinensis TaxID=246437 RepID=L9L5J4_TUPCH|nr:Tumor necrosis factor receptor superfamily member 9 [Tupaia chinensis]
MGNGYYNMVATVLLVMNFERTRSTQTSCSNCSAGVFRTKKACSLTSNAECECISGFRCMGSGCTMCVQECKQGQELTKEAFMRPVQTAQEEDACSCRFPEEEEGEYNL